MADFGNREIGVTVKASKLEPGVLVSGMRFDRVNTLVVQDVRPEGSRMVRVDVVEQEKEGRPYKGTIRFKIITTMRDPDGAETNDRLDKQFNYEYDVREKRWLILYTPAPPARR